MTENERKLRGALSNAISFLEGYVEAAATLTSKWKAAKEGVEELEAVLKETKPEGPELEDSYQGWFCLKCTTVEVADEKIDPEDEEFCGCGSRMVPVLVTPMKGEAK